MDGFTPAAITASVVLTQVMACTFAPSGAGDGQAADAAADAAATIDTAAASCASWNPPNVDPCDPRLGEPAVLDFDGGAFGYDTDTGALTSLVSQLPVPPGALVEQGDGTIVRVVNVASLRVSGSSTLTVTGAHALVFVVHGDATIDGVIDVSARLDATGTMFIAGPGGNDAARCVTGTGRPGEATPVGSAGGGGGAGGGGFAANAGDGGNGHGSGHGAGGGKGASGGGPSIEPLRGGCAGGKGGDDGDPSIDAGGHAGDGGGALEISARGDVVVAGAIAAGGSGGGAGALARSGGGGGGSGGAILLDGETVRILATASLCANGAGGGEGGQLAVASQPGGMATCSQLRSTGGANQADGGDGGAGGAGAVPAGGNATNGTSNAGGGGGGGSVGRIRVRGRTTRTVDGAATVSPAPAS